LDVRVVEIERTGQRGCLLRVDGNVGYQPPQLLRLLQATRSLALELGPEVRVNGVSPGAILWPDGPEWQNEDERQRILDRSVLKRVGEPDDIAGAVEFLATAPYVTGQIIAVDGGRSIVL
jgi:pteridine reductase